MQTAQSASAEHWIRVAVNCIEDLQEAVLGAQLVTMQLSQGIMQGSLLFGTDDPLLVSSGYIVGRTHLRGPISATATTLGVGLRLVGARHWLREVSSGSIAVIRPGDSHDCIYAAGSLYACATLPDEEWERLGAEQDIVLDRRAMGSSRVCRNVLAPAALDLLRTEFTRAHIAQEPDFGAALRASRHMLVELVAVLGREPRLHALRQHRGYARIAERACLYIEENLSRPLSISAITRASCTSQRSLYRAFHKVFEETPQSYVRKLRLNRIRRDLASRGEASCTVAMLANRWGVSELGRLSSEYRELFGELPSRTRKRFRTSHPEPGERTDMAGTA